MRFLNYILILLLFSSLHSKSQDKPGYKTISKEEAVKMLQRLNHWFTTTPSYSFEVTHATYAGHNTMVAYDLKRGYYKKFPNGTHSLTAGIQTIQNKSFQITLDTAKKLIAVTNAKINEASNFSMQEYIKALEQCSSIKLADDGKVKTLVLEFTKGSAASSMELSLKGEFLQSITIFYAGEVKSLQGQMVKPKMKIVFEKYTTPILPVKNELNEDRFIYMDGDIMRLKETYKGYSLYDQRIKNEKQ